MPSHFHRLSKDVIIYGLGGIVLRLFSFVTLPIFTRIFSPADYGIIETVGAVTSVIILFATLGLDSASQRSYFDYRPDQQIERRAVLSTTFWTLLGWSGGLAFLSVVVSGIFAPRLLGNPSYALLLGIAAVGMPVTVIGNFFRDILRLWHQPVRYALFAIVDALLTVGWTLYLVAVLGWGLPGNYIGPLVGGLIALGIGYSLVHDAIHLAFNRRELRAMLAYGLPLVPVAVSTWVLQLADRFFLLRYVSPSELGLYGLGVRLSNLLLLGVTAFGVAWPPFMLELYNRDPLQERQVRARALTYVTFVLSLGALCLSVFAREFFLTVTAPSFMNAYKVVGLLSGSIVVIGMNAVVMSGITLSRQTHYFARYTILSALINVLLNFLLIPPLGMIGAALATLLSYVSLFCFYYRRAQMLSAALFDYRRLLAILVTAAGLVALGTFINLNPLWVSVAIKALLVLAFPLLVWLLRGLEPRELDYLRALALKMGEKVLR